MNGGHLYDHNGVALAALGELLRNLEPGEAGADDDYTLVAVIHFPAQYFRRGHEYGAVVCALNELGNKRHRAGGVYNGVIALGLKQSSAA